MPGVVTQVWDRCRAWGPRRTVAFVGARAPGKAASDRAWSSNLQELEILRGCQDYKIRSVPLRVTDPRSGRDIIIDALVVQPPELAVQRDATGTRDVEQKILGRTLVVSHGNGHTLNGNYLTFLVKMADACKANVFAYDYPGYGASEGEPTEALCHLALEASVNYVAQQGVAFIVLVGISVGSAPTVHAAALPDANPSIKGVVLWSGFESGARAFFGIVWSKCLRGKDLFRSTDKAGKISVPVFMMHSVLDAVTPIQNAVAMHGKCAKSIIPFFMDKTSAHHHAYALPRQPCFAGIASFMRVLEQPETSHWSSQQWRHCDTPKKDAENELQKSPTTAKPYTGHVSYFPHPFSQDRSKLLFGIWILSWVFLLKTSWLHVAGSILLGIVAVLVLLWLSFPNIMIIPAIAATGFTLLSLVGTIFCVWKYVPTQYSNIPGVACSMVLFCHLFSECLQRCCYSCEARCQAKAAEAKACEEPLLGI